MLLRPLNTLIALLTFIIILLGFSILWNANDSPPAIVPFSPQQYAPVSPISVVPAASVQQVPAQVEQSKPDFSRNSPPKEHFDEKAHYALKFSDPAEESPKENKEKSKVDKSSKEEDAKKPVFVPDNKKAKDTSEDFTEGGKYLAKIRKGNLPNPVRIFLLENAGSHEEVFAALVYAFAQIPNSYIYQWLFRPRFNIFAVLRSFNLKNLARPRFSTSIKFNEKNVMPDIILATTCEFDLTRIKPQMMQMLHNGSYLFCTIHHADRWHNASSYKYYKEVIPWIEAGRVTFLFLSGHTRRFVEENVVPSWEAQHRSAVANFEVFVPVFPVPLEGKKEVSFSLQGNYESVRRDYDSIFGQFGSFTKNHPDKPQYKELRMHLIGHGKHPEVPEMIQDRVEFNEGLEFLEFYRILSESFALLPAFASNEYYDRKASSSVPASLISGVPIVGKRRLLQTYDYMTEDAMWIQEDDEEDMDVVGRILEMSETEIEEQKARTRTRNIEVVDENINKAVTWARGIDYRQKRTGLETIREGWNWMW
ncbi:hypothetical protein V1512DRAFT_264434 [Lipomyces arxii]|uniref:uncharacterized protein n=1 Tax=Lipomyces arxii TaxID=56418 RepID=UPI0034CE5D82